jgi:hypothetical protein
MKISNWVEAHHDPSSADDRQQSRTKPEAEVSSVLWDRIPIEKTQVPPKGSDAHDVRESVVAGRRVRHPDMRQSRLRIDRKSVV